jgi:hypothetical protein
VVEEQDEVHEKIHVEGVHEVSEEITKNKQILEEFLAWKRNVLFLYGLVITCVRVALTHCPMVPYP